jgi:predicted NBD/HSP70 family sugar kinase
MTNYATTTIGMDLGDTWSVLCVLDGSGEAIEQSRVRSRRKEMRRCTHTLGRARGRVWCSRSGRIRRG